MRDTVLHLAVFFLGGRIESLDGLPPESTHGLLNKYRGTAYYRETDSKSECENVLTETPNQGND